MIIFGQKLVNLAIVDQCSGSAESLTILYSVMFSERQGD